MVPQIPLRNTLERRRVLADYIEECALDVLAQSPVTGVSRIYLKFQIGARKAGNIPCARARAKQSPRFRIVATFVEANENLAPKHTIRLGRTQNNGVYTAAHSVITNRKLNDIKSPAPAHKIILPPSFIA